MKKKKWPWEIPGAPKWTANERVLYKHAFNLGRALQRDSDAGLCRVIQTQYLGLVKPVHVVAKECEDAINENTRELT